MSLTFTLLPSPLLGPVAWEPVRDVLRARGHQVTVAAVPARPSGPDDVLARLRAAVPSDGDVVLVPHSNAGLYAPALAAQVLAEQVPTAPERRVATVYVDAALPSATPTTPLAPAGLLAHLAGLADDDGRLPPWTRWWDDADVDRLFQGTAWRRRVEEAQPRLPLAYFRARVGVPAGWATRPSAYLSFGDTYEREVTEARGLGWPVAVLDGSHLHMLHDPDTVVRAVLGLLEQARQGSSSA